MKLIKITSLGCPSCIIMNNRINELREELDFSVVDLDYDFDDIEKYNIGKILPVIIFCDDEKEISRLIGEQSLEILREEINKYR